MNGCFPAGAVLGFRVQIHRLFVPFLGLLALPALLRGGAREGAAALGIAAAAYVSILLHEVGHCLAARRHGVPVLDITLWPLGGLARIGPALIPPPVELAVVAAGPLVNLALWLGFDLLAGLGAPVEDLATLNLALLLCNLLPCPPLDGARLLRAVLALRLAPALSDRVAAGTGTALVAALALGGGILGHAGMILFGVLLLMVRGLEARLPAGGPGSRAA